MCQCYQYLMLGALKLKTQLLQQWRSLHRMISHFPLWRTRNFIIAIQNLGFTHTRLYIPCLSRYDSQSLVWLIWSLTAMPKHGMLRRWAQAPFVQPNQSVPSGSISHIMYMCVPVPSLMLCLSSMLGHNKKSDLGCFSTPRMQTRKELIG